MNTPFRDPGVQTELVLLRETCEALHKEIADRRVVQDALLAQIADQAKRIVWLEEQVLAAHGGTWEYKVQAHHGLGCKETERLLNKAGREGWTLVSSTDHHAFFRRPLRGTR